MSTLNPTTEGLAPWKRIFVGFLSACVVICTLLWLAISGLVILQIIGRVYEGGELVFAGIIITAPPVFIFTTIALLLVGPKRCKIAWISALLYFSPVIIASILSAIGTLFGFGK